MLTTIQGFYEHGKIVLKEPAPVTEKTEVIVTFLKENNKESSDKKRVPGGLKGRVSIPDDFNDPLDTLKITCKIRCCIY